MQLLKNAKIADEYGVFRGSVGKWIKAAQNKENNLQLEIYNDKWYIIDNAHNRSELNNLAERALKYRNKSAYEKVVVDPKLYEIFSYTNLVELISKMEESKMIPIKFCYLNEGANFWDEFIYETYNSEHYLSTIGNQLLQDSLTYITDCFKKYDQVNIVDVGVGNGNNLKFMIDRLLRDGFKIKYTGIDISPRMLEIIKSNLNQWYPDIEVETEIGDMDYVVIREKLFSNKLTNKNSCNIILFLGCTIGNVYESRRVFRNFYDSMGEDDYFVVDNRLDLVHLRTMFATPEQPVMIKFVSWIPNLLGIRDDMFERINKYDEKSKSRVQVLKLNKDLDIEFNLNNSTKIVSFKDGDEITVWNHFSHTLDNLIKEVRENNLGISFLARSSDKSEVLLICEVDKN